MPPYRITPVQAIIGIHGQIRRQAIRAEPIGLRQYNFAV